MCVCLCVVFMCVLPAVTPAPAGVAVVRSPAASALLPAVYVYTPISQSVRTQHHKKMQPIREKADRQAGSQSEDQKKTKVSQEENRLAEFNVLVR